MIAQQYWPTVLNAYNKWLLHVMKIMTIIRGNDRCVGPVQLSGLFWRHGYLAILLIYKTNKQAAIRTDNMVIYLNTSLSSLRLAPPTNGDNKATNSKTTMTAE